VRYLSLSGVRPRPHIVATAITRFELTGRSGPHSDDGLLLAEICNHCIFHRIPFVLRYLAGRSGYMIERIKD
jgi:hypothetical protein